MTSGVPYAFIPGTKAMANQVNANFLAVTNSIEEVNQRLTDTNENILDTMENDLLKRDLSNLTTTGQAVLDNKANCDLSNINISESFATTLNNSDIRTVIKTGQEGNSWYRIYSDGWCEQGGNINITTNSSARILLLFPYLAYPYTCLLSFLHNGNSASKSVNPGGMTREAFTLYTAADSGTKLWKTEGYIDLSLLEES